MIQELKWDTEFFGRKIGRLLEVPSEKVVGSILSQARKQGYRYLTCRLGADEIERTRILEKYGFYLTDIGVIFERGTVTGEGRTSLRVREAFADDIGALRTMVKGIFIHSRFYHDPFFTADEADGLYQSWIENSVRGFADKVFLVDKKGFITCTLSGSTGEIPLVCVSSSQQNKGIGTALIFHALHWFRERGVMVVTARTQANNAKAIRFYNSLRFVVRTIDVSMGKIFAS